MATKPKKTAKTEAETTIKAIKGFDKNLRCRGYQFEVGKTYEQPGKIIVCENGFHAVTGSPFDAWNHYPILADDGSLNRWAEVTLSGQTSAKTEQNDSKIAAGKITIDVELHLPELIRRAVAWVVDATKGKGDDPSGDSAQIGSSGNYAQIGSSGNSAQIGSSGDSAQIGSSGNSAQIGSSGDSAQIGSSGNYAQIGSSGNYARIGSSGNYAQIGSSGNSAQIGSSGDYAQIGSSGNYARIDVSGDSGVVASAGVNARVKAKAGTWVSVAEFDRSIPPKCIGFATGKVGQNGIPAETWLIAKGGKLVAAE